jgi:membrane fusion protein (multidrug efflux system)
MFLIFAIGFYACEQKNNNAVLKVFPTITPAIIDTSTHVDYVAEIKSVKNTELRAKITGYLASVHVDEGQFVRSGQLLFTIDNREYKQDLFKKRALLNSAHAEVRSAELELQNTKNLVEKGVVSKIELEFSKNKLAAAKAKEEEAKSEQEKAELILSYSQIKAPFSGLINRLPHKIGSSIEEGTLMTSLSQNDEVFAYFDVAEKEYLDFMSQLTRKGQKERQVQLILANGKAHKNKGLIETMDGEFDEASGNLAFRARFENKEGLLKNGASGKVRIEKQFKQVMVIPQKSTFEIQDRVFVYVLNKYGKAQIRQVQIAHRIPHLYILSGGLKSHETIIYEGIQSIENGMKVKSKKMNFKAILQEISTL